MKVFKFELDIYGCKRITTNRIDKVLKVDIQRGQPVVWVLVDDTTNEFSYNICSVMTGAKIATEILYMGIT